MHFTVFLILPRKLHPAVTTTVFRRDQLQLEECMTSLVSFFNPYLGRNGCQTDYEKLKITSKQTTFSQISHDWDCLLDYGPFEFL